MTHQDLADNFCAFVYALMQDIDDISCISKTDEMFYRACFQKLYYALYHKILHHDTSLSESEAPGKHESIMQKINRSKDYQLIQIYSKMKALRIWADYKLSSTPESTQNIKYYQNQVYKVLQRSTINI